MPRQYQQPIWAPRSVRGRLPGLGGRPPQGPRVDPSRPARFPRVPAQGSALGTPRAPSRPPRGPLAVVCVETSAMLVLRGLLRSSLHLATPEGVPSLQLHVLHNLAVPCVPPAFRLGWHMWYLFRFHVLPSLVVVCSGTPKVSP